MKHIKNGLMLLCIVLSLSGCAALDQWYEDEYCSVESAYAHGINDAKAYKNMDAHYGRSCPNRNFELLSSYKRGYQYGLRFTESPQTRIPTRINIHETRVYRYQRHPAPPPARRWHFKKRHHSRHPQGPVVTAPVRPVPPVVAAPVKPVHPIKPVRPRVHPIKPMRPHTQRHHKMHQKATHPSPKKMQKQHRKGWGCMTAGAKKVCGLNCKRVGQTVTCQKYAS